MKGAFLAAIPIIVLSTTLSEVRGNEATITLGHTGSQPLNLFDLFRFPVKQVSRMYTRSSFFKHPLLNASIDKNLVADIGHPEGFDPNHVERIR